MPSHGLKTSNNVAKRFATGTRFGPVSGLTGDKICLLSVSYKGTKGPVTSPIVPHDIDVVKRPALGDLNDVRSPLTHGVRARRVGCALRGPTHSGEISRSARAAVPALGRTSAVLGTN